MTAVLVKPLNLRGELIRSKNDDTSILSSSPFSSYVRVRRMKNNEVIKMKCKDLSLSSNKSHPNNEKFSIRSESTADLYWRKTEKEKEGVDERINADKLDRWIEQSIQEIVKNIGEAPFLMQIYSQGSSKLKLRKEEASPNNWHVMKKRWSESNSTPDGIILVEKLKDDEVMLDDVLNNKEYVNGDSKTWGLVAQGRGMDCAASCYILNACRVKSTAGFCTHFCLIRAKNFGQSLEAQLTKAWLQ